MPSSMIFASLVVLWLLILVPAVARRRQEVARPSVAALSGRVLDRPRRVPGQATGREREVDGMDEETTRGEDHVDGDQTDDLFTHTVDEREDRRWERPPPRYRPGRGGFDPEAAALAARRRYAFRQRVVLTMLIMALVTGVIAAFALSGLWWVHAAVDIALVAYLVYLRRQVRLEEAIRERRAARMAGTRRPSAAEDPELDAWARRGRELTRRDEGYEAAEDDAERYDDEYDDRDDQDGDGDGDVDEEPERLVGAGAPLRERDAREDEPADPEPALPRLRPAPPPALPAGTALVEADEDDPELHDLDGPARPGYRRAAGE
ncbi:hypothetical protein FHX44_112520 [Pseudonocardia hierapolitana]|uniref:Uncharacterized protein n=1 Tax=Pseudonocardia hierapolitana TaxID=1128676 RepID=A0A561SP43_9PSEU|nr:gephyrin-like molybdotransferase receptor GlpR [Pseudonocardia hierapolitana]TWF76626.1 hypothetical protein FHX44_112520 [Pseudonocardia hierapolitana]